MLLYLEFTFVHTLALTFVHAAAEAALEAPAALNELHEGAHVGFAAVAAHRPRLSMVHQVEGCLEGASQRAHVGEAFLGVTK